MVCNAARILLVSFMICSMVGAAGMVSGAGQVDINTATVQELETLPGVGPALAERIVAYRDAAPFQTPEEIKNVKGIGDAKYAKLKTLIKVE